MDFEKMAVLTLPVSRLCHVEARAKFGENRTNGWRVIQVFANFNMAAGGHLVLRFSPSWDHRRLRGEKLMLYTKFGANRTKRFEVNRICFNFGFRRRPSWIMKNDIFDHSAVWAVSRQSSVPNLVRIGRTVRVPHSADFFYQNRAVSTSPRHNHP